MHNLEYWDQTSSSFNNIIYNSFTAIDITPPGGIVSINYIMALKAEIISPCLELHRGEKKGLKRKRSFEGAKNIIIYFISIFFNTNSVLYREYVELLKEKTTISCNSK